MPYNAQAYSERWHIYLIWIKWNVKLPNRSLNFSRFNHDDILHIYLTYINKQVHDKSKTIYKFICVFPVGWISFLLILYLIRSVWCSWSNMILWQPRWILERWKYSLKVYTGFLHANYSEHDLFCLLNSTET